MYTSPTSFAYTDHLLRRVPISQLAISTKLIRATYTACFDHILPSVSCIRRMKARVFAASSGRCRLFPPVGVVAVLVPLHT